MIMILMFPIHSYIRTKYITVCFFSNKIFLNRIIYEIISRISGEKKLYLIFAKMNKKGYKKQIS